MNYDEDEWGCVDDTLERQQWESRTTKDILIERCVKYIKLLKLKRELRHARKNSWH